MKKHFILLALLGHSILGLGQGLLDQTIKVSTQTEYTIRQLMEEITAQTDLSFSYARLQSHQTMRFEHPQITIREALDRALDLELYRYKLKGKKILIYPKSEQKQKTQLIRGYVSDGDAALTGATVIIRESGEGMTTSVSGYFSIETPKDSCLLRVSFVGYQSREIKWSSASNSIQAIELSPKQLDEVVVQTQKEPTQIDISSTEMGTFRFTPKMIEDRPILLGEPDVLKTLQLLPGVQNGHEGTSGLYVRGGGPDQNLILLDGVPMYNTSHLFGFVSSFNTNSISEMKLVKGAFPARYGGRLSSVVDIQLKEGNKEKIHGNASLSPITSQITLEGPILKDKTSFILSARRTFLDLAIQPFIKTEEKNYSNRPDELESKKTLTDPNYYFYDLSAKLSHELTSRDQLTLSAYQSQDKASLYEEVTKIYPDQTLYSEYFNKVEWTNRMANLKWVHTWNSRFETYLTGAYNSYQFGGQNRNYKEITTDTTTFNYEQFNARSSVRDWILQLGASFEPASQHYIRFGINFINHEYEPDVTASTSTNEEKVTRNGQKTNSNEFSAFIEDDLTIAPWLHANLGIHASMYQVDSVTYRSLQPRLALNLILGKNLSLKTSYTQMAQYLHLLTHQSIGIPTDLWVPATATVKPQNAHQMTTGLYYTNLSRKLEASLEGYYKKMDHLIEYQEGSSYIDQNETWEEKITTGHGNSYGVEVFVSKKMNKTSGWIGYTLSWTNRQFDDLNYGDPFPYKWDRRHDLKLVLNHQLNEKVYLAANWVYASGFRTTIPESKFSFDNTFISISDIPYYEEKNGHQVRDYHRLDLSCRFYKQKPWGERNWIIGLYNAYYRKNVFYIEESDRSHFEHNPETNESQHVRNEGYEEYSLFPIIPSISYQLIF